MLFSVPESVKTPIDMVRLWMHECDRVYRDKLVETRDMEIYDKIQGDICKKFFEVNKEIEYTNVSLSKAGKCKR